MVPIYHLQRTRLLSIYFYIIHLDVLNQRVEMDKRDTCAIRLTLPSVFSPQRRTFVPRLVLTGGEAVLENMPAVLENVSEPTSTTTTLPTTLAMPSSTTPLSVDDYDISDTDVANGSVVCHSNFEREAADAIL
ncbi:hypothetical protein Tco_0519371 [Tanacetum coccineum]